MWQKLKSRLDLIVGIFLLIIFITASWKLTIRYNFLITTFLFFITGLLFGGKASSSIWIKGLLIYLPLLLVAGYMALGNGLILLLPLAAIISTYFGLYIGMLETSPARRKQFICFFVWLALILSTNYIFLPRLFVQILTRAERTPFPPFEVLKLDNQIFKSSDYSGKVMIVSFWSSWSEPSLAQFSELQQIYEKYMNNPNVGFVAINTRDKFGSFGNFLKKNIYTFPIGIDQDTKTTDQLAVQNIPQILLIDKYGKIRIRHKGFIENTGYLVTYLSEHIDGLLGEK